LAIYFWWGEDDYQLQKRVKLLRQKVVDPSWQDFNYRQFPCLGEQEVIAGLVEAITPVFGAGDRLTWLSNTTICQKCSDETLKELERTLPQIPPNSHLLFTAIQKPDSRLKVTKLLQKFASFEEFAVIPPWKPEAIGAEVKKQAQELGLSLSQGAVDYLVEAVGNDLRRMDMELHKLVLSYGTHSQTISREQVQELVLASAASSIQLAQALKNGEGDRALRLLAELFRNNEAGLRICATLVGQFRTWLLVKLAIAGGEKDETIAKIAELGNPKRVYFLRQEVQSHPAEQWLQVLPILLELEVSLKRGADEATAFSRMIFQVCQLWRGEGSG
jgi:DNA polymerase-3 subunit delta